MHKTAKMSRTRHRARFRQADTDAEAKLPPALEDSSVSDGRQDTIGNGGSLAASHDLPVPLARSTTPLISIGA